MKKLMLMGMVAVLGSATVFATTLAEARGKIDQAIEDPKVMSELAKGLKIEELKQFLGDVNKAIDDMPASDVEKAAKHLNANAAAVKAVSKDDRLAILAEVFATVPPQSLTVINERFAADLFNRAGDPNLTFTDEQFTEIAVDAMKKINARTDDTVNGSPRSAFAILMFLRASNGTPADLLDKLVDTMTNNEAKSLAKEEWIPPTLPKEGHEPDYEPILMAADAGRRPDYQQVLVVAGPQYAEAMFADLIGKNIDPKSFSRTRTPVFDAVANPLIHQIPTLRDEVFDSGIIVPPGGNPDIPPQPTPYGGQTIR